VNFLKYFALFIYLSLVPVLLFIPNSSYLVWTVVIPLIPLFIIFIGFDRWRNICPLAWFAKLSQSQRIGKKVRLNLWFEENFYLIQFGTLFIAFNLRIYLLNYETLSLALFFIAVSVMAYLSGLFFSGKTWCQYLCPVSLVEKIYSGSNSGRLEGTSACTSCSACKENCSDLGLEKSYWKELKLSHRLHKKIAFYSFPGLVFGFYFYFYMQTGSWDYYFSGEWTTSNSGLYEHIFQNGLYVNIPIPIPIPLFFAAPLVMGGCSILSYVLLLKFEKVLYNYKKSDEEEKDIFTHITYLLSAYLAFNIFYIFAGAPVYQYYPTAYSLFHFVVIVSSTILFLKELPRRDYFVIQERIARKILKKDVNNKLKNKNLKEIYYSHINDKENHEMHLETYKDTVLDLLGDGVLTSEDFSVLDRIRGQFQISKIEHDRIIRGLKDEYDCLFNNDTPMSSEKFFQKKSYRQLIKNILLEDKEIDKEQLELLRLQFELSVEEHEEILKDLLEHDEVVFSQIQSITYQLMTLSEVQYMNIYHDDSKESRFLKYTVELAITRTLSKMKMKMKIVYNLNSVEQLISLFQDRSYLIEHLEKTIAPFDSRCYETLRKIYFQLNHVSETFLDNTTRPLEMLVSSGYDEVVGAALYFAYKRDVNMKSLSIEVLEKQSTYEVETFIKDIEQENNKEVSLIEKMAYLHSVPLFKTIDYEALLYLAKEVSFQEYHDKSDIVTQNRDGNSLYIILSGEAGVYIETPDGENRVATVSSGNYIGDVAVIAQSKRTATVRCDGYVEVLRLSGDIFTDLIYKNPAISIDVMREMTTRFIKNSA
jgi:hypothetical protein